MEVNQNLNESAIRALIEWGNPNWIKPNLKLDLNGEWSKTGMTFIIDRLQCKLWQWYPVDGQILASREKQWLEMANLWWGAEIEELGPISEDEERKSRQSEVAKVAVDQEWIKARELARKSGK